MVFAPSSMPNSTCECISTKFVGIKSFKNGFLELKNIKIYKFRGMQRYEIIKNYDKTFLYSFKSSIFAKN